MPVFDEARHYSAEEIEAAVANLLPERLDPADRLVMDRLRRRLFFSLVWGGEVFVDTETGCFASRRNEAPKVEE